MDRPHEVLVVKSEHGFVIEPLAHPDNMTAERYQDRCQRQQAHRKEELEAHGLDGEVTIVPVTLDTYEDQVRSALALHDSVDMSSVSGLLERN